jgi:hypothetical protein
MVINNHHHSAEETSQSTPPLAHPIHSRKLIASFFALSAPVSSPRSAQDAPERGREASRRRRLFRFKKKAASRASDRSAFGFNRAKLRSTTDQPRA